MAGTNPIATWLLTNFNVQTATAYKATIDGDNAVAQRLVANFAPSQQATPNMTVLVAAGHLYGPGGLTEVGAQTSATIVAPVSNPRIDRIVLDHLTGIISVVTGVENASPVAPAIPVGSRPIAQVLLQTSSSSITNSMITDERDLAHIGQRHRTLVALTSSGTWTVPAGVYEIDFVIAGAGGGGPGGTGFAANPVTPGFPGCLVIATVPVTPSSVLTVTIGAGGSGGSGGAFTGTISAPSGNPGGSGSGGGLSSLALASTWTLTANGGRGNNGRTGVPATGSATGTLPTGSDYAVLNGAGSGGGGEGPDGDGYSVNGGTGQTGGAGLILIMY